MSTAHRLAHRSFGHLRLLMLVQLPAVVLLYSLLTVIDIAPMCNRVIRSSKQ